MGNISLGGDRLWENVSVGVRQTAGKWQCGSWITFGKMAMCVWSKAVEKGQIRSRAGCGKCQCGSGTGRGQC